MDIVLNEINKHEVELSITAPWSEVCDDYATLLKLYSKLPIKGFRQSRASMVMIEKKFRKELQADFTYQCGQRLCRKALKNEGLQTGSSAVISDVDIVPNERFSFKSTFLRMPKFELPDYANLKLQTQNTEDQLTEISEILLNLTPFEIPDDFISHELAFSESELNTSEDMLRKDAEKRIRLLLILKQIGDIDGIEVDEVDVETRIKELAAESEVTYQELKKHLVEAGGIYRLKDYLLAENVLNYIAEININTIKL